MPAYPPPLVDFTVPHWEVTLKIVTPTGTFEGTFMLQTQADGSGTMLWSTMGGPFGYENLGGPMRGNADRVQIGLDLDPTKTGLPRLGFASPYQPSGDTFQPGMSGYCGGVTAPCHIIGINLGIRAGGYLGCNVSIAYFAQDAKPIAQFVAQDVSYYRQWNFLNPPPAIYLPQATNLYPYPSSPPVSPGWTYARGVFPVGGQWYYSFMPLPTEYQLRTPTCYAGGKPVFANINTPDLGAMFHLRLPTSANALPDPRAGTSPYNARLAALDANVANLAATYANEWAFIGDIFPLSPYNFVPDPFNEIFWLGQQPWSSYGVATGGGPGMLISHSPPIYVDPPIGPDFNYYVMDGNSGGVGIPMDAYGFRVAPPTPFLYSTGIPLGLGCTIYYLNASAPKGIPTGV